MVASLNNGNYNISGGGGGGRNSGGIVRGEPRDLRHGARVKPHEVAKRQQQR
jgi:hypothetical protein